LIADHLGYARYPSEPPKKFPMNTKMHQTIIPSAPATRKPPVPRTPPAHPSKNASLQSAPQPTMSNNTQPSDDDRAAPKDSHPTPTDQAISLTKRRSNQASSSPPPPSTTALRGRGSNPDTP
jgi:hypothetical protein